MPAARPTAPRPELLIQSVLSLPELGFRVPWLRELFLKTDRETLARTVDDIANRAHSGDASARGTLLSIALCLAQSRDEPWLDALRTEAQGRALLNLQRLLGFGSDTPEDAERDVPVPLYSREKELSVGERRSLARRPTRAQLEKLILDPHPLVLAQVFLCPKLTEDDVLGLVTKRPARLGAIFELIGHLKWLARRRIRTALVLNPGCPAGIATPLLSTCPREDIVLVAQNSTLRPSLRTIANELLDRLPPLEQPDHVEWQ